MNKCLKGKIFANGESRRSVTLAIIECDASCTSHEKKGAKLTWSTYGPILSSTFLSVKSKKEYIVGNRVMCKGKIECSQCKKKTFSFYKGLLIFTFSFRSFNCCVLQLK